VRLPIERGPEPGAVDPRAIPRGRELLWASEPVSLGGRPYRPLYSVERRTVLTGEQLTEHDREAKATENPTEKPGDDENQKNRQNQLGRDHGQIPFIRVLITLLLSYLLFLFPERAFYLENMESIFLCSITPQDVGKISESET